MKISITLHDKTYSVESEPLTAEHADIDQMAELFKGLLVSAGFHPQSVDGIFNTSDCWFPETDADPEGSTRSIMSFPEDFTNKHDNEKCEPITGQRDC